MRPLILAFAVWLVAACLPAGMVSAFAAERVEEVDADKDGRKETKIYYDASGQISRVTVDKNGDGKVDLTAFYVNGFPDHAERDTDFNGRIDAWIKYDRKGNATEIDYDQHVDGKPDRWVYMKDGRVYRQEFDRNFDGKPDLRIFQDGKRLIKKEYDDNFDGKYETVRKAPVSGSLEHIETGAPEEHTKAPK